MADNRNNGGAHGENDLKLHDSEKNNDIFSTIPGIDNKFSMSASADAFKSVKKIKKTKVPVVVDIIIAVLLLAIIGGAVFGCYYLFRYFTVDYENVGVTYVFAVPRDKLIEGNTYSNMKNKFLFCDVDGNTYGFGKISNAEISQDSGMLLVTVVVNSQYRAEEGYFIDGLVLAVGKNYTLHTENLSLDGTVVELHGKK